MKKTRKIVSVLLAVLLMFATVSVSASAEDKLNYVVLGDSIAFGSGLANPVEACYGKIIADTCDFDYKNYSVPGATTNDLIVRLSDELIFEDVKNADIISISIGGNDFLMNNLVKLMFDSIVKNDYTAFDGIGESFYKNLTKIIGIIRGGNENALILMQTLYNPQEGYLKEPYQQGADRINAGILRYTEENPGEIVVVDIGNALKDNAENFAGDAIHPSVKGNELIAKEILSVLYSKNATDKTELNITTEGKDFNISPVFAWSFKIYGVLFHFISVVFGPVIKLFG